MTLQELNIKISADIGDIQRSLARVEGDMRSFSRDSARALQGFDRAMADMGDSAAKAGDEIKEGLGGALESIETPLGDVGSIIARLKGPAGFAAIAVAAGGGDYPEHCDEYKQEAMEAGSIAIISAGAGMAIEILTGGAGTPIAIGGIGVFIYKGAEALTKWSFYWGCYFSHGGGGGDGGGDGEDECGTPGGPSDC